MTNDVPDQPEKKDFDRKRLIKIAKCLIGVAVCVGLVFAGRSAVTQWQQKTAETQSEIDKIETQIAATGDTAVRQPLIQQRDRLAKSLPSLGNLDWPKMILAAVLYGLGLLPPCFVLREAVGSLGHRPAVPISIASQLIGHLGKYVPGKAMVVVLRVGVLSRDNVSPIVGTVSVFMETLLMMAVGAVVSGAIICWLPVPTWMIAVSYTHLTLPTIYSV